MLSFNSLSSQQFYQISKILSGDKTKSEHMQNISNNPIQCTEKLHAKLCNKLSKLNDKIGCLSLLYKTVQKERPEMMHMTVL